MILLRALFDLWNFGVTFAYHPPKADVAFGENLIPKYKRGLTCPTCQDSKPVPEESGMEEGQPCPTCGSPLMNTPVIDGFSNSPKTRVLIDLFSPLHVKVPYYARAQKDFGYLICTLDQPKSLLQSLYPHISEDIENDDSDMGM